MVRPQQTFARLLVWLLAGLMLLSPEIQVLAQEAQTSPKIETQYVLPQACVVGTLRPRAILTSDFCAMMPIEVLQAASRKYVGVDVLDLDRVLISCDLASGGPPSYAIFLRFEAPVVGKLHPQITEPMQRQTDERPHYVAPQPLMPSLYFPTDKSILATPEATLQSFLTNRVPPEAEALLADLSSAAEDDLYLDIDFVPLRPLVNTVMLQNEIPLQVQHFYAAPDLVKRITLRLNVSHPGTNELVVEANNATDAETLQGIVQKTIDMFRAEIQTEIQQLAQNSDPVQRAMGQYQQRMMDSISAGLLPEREDSQLVIFRQEWDTEHGKQTALTTAALSGVLIALLLPAVQAAREAARRTSSINNMKQINLALHNYAVQDHLEFLPPYANFDAQGKPLLSWRVHILPYLDEQELYNQFHLDEPWDSEHNKALISKMPALYLDPSSRWSPADGRTHYLGVKGKGMIFDGTDEGTRFPEITDGVANTIMLVQSNDDRATIWTKPDDWEFDEKNPFAGLVPPLHPGIFLASLADASVRAISEQIDVNAFKALLTIAGGEVAQRP